MTRGLFVTFEGGEGVGKSTQISTFVSALRELGIEVLETREPGGTRNAERIRSVLKEHTDEIMPDVAEMLLMFSARAINVANTIRPTLETGSWVVADRFTDSTRAYQGGGRGLPSDRIDTLANWVHGDVNPDVTILLDAPVEVGMQRANQRGESDRIETEKIDFFNRVRETYLALARSEAKRFIVVDASQPLAQVQAEIRQVAERLVGDFRTFDA
ncbi:MAG: dTMP kinase [Pseudomonadota bacterium]